MFCMTCQVRDIAPLDDFPARRQDPDPIDAGIEQLRLAWRLKTGLFGMSPDDVHGTPMTHHHDTLA